MNMNRNKAERILIEADQIADCVMHGFDMTMETDAGRELYDRAFTTYVRKQIGELPMSELYDALTGAPEIVSASMQH
jgi:hypothetical protein